MRFIPGALAILAWSTLAVAAPERPNIVLIIGDDVGWPYHGFLTSPQVIDTNVGRLPVQEVVHTPNLDALSSEGVTFSRGYTTGSVCTPSLTTLLSTHGLHALQWRARELELEALPYVGAIPRTEESRYFRTLPRELERRGYVSWEGGKMWHGTFADAGFTHGLATSIGGPLNPVGNMFGREGWDLSQCGSTAEPDSSCPALDPLRDFLDETAGAPFFVWFAPMLPHVPYDAPQAYRDPFEALGIGEGRVDYLANLTWFDELVGELLDELEARGIADDTLVIYCSDNGWGLGFQAIGGTGKGKGTLYDLGFRTPIIFRWPRRIPQDVAYPDLVSIADIPATILDYAFGADELVGAEGSSLRERIEGGGPAGRSEIVTFDAGLALVNDTWRYLLFPDFHEELYRIDIDPFERNDRSAAQPTVLASLRTLAVEYVSAALAPPTVTEIVGRLVDPLTRKPLEGAEVSLVGGPARLISIVGPEGWFRFGPLDPAFSFRLRANRSAQKQLQGDPTGIPMRPRAPIARAGVFNSLAASLISEPLGEYGATLSGTLHDAKTLSPLAGAIVRVKTGRVGDRSQAIVATQPDGSFRVENLRAPATYRLSVNSTETYRGLAREVEIAGLDEVVELELLVEPR